MGDNCRRGMAVGCAGVLLLLGLPAFALVEATPWGPFDFPARVRTQREAEAMFAEARVPIVIAIRFLADSERADAPWINRYLACGSAGSVRADYAAALVRASTFLAQRLAVDLDDGRRAAAALRAGNSPDQPVRYGGPVTLVLEPARISADGEVLAPPVAVEPHLRVFVSAVVPRCARDASGAFGRAREVDGTFMVTASPALELGWPTYSASALGQRIVMATENLLTEGFCCGQESNFGLESLLGIHDFRDYQTKARLKATLRTLATAKRRDPAWTRRVRDAFGIPERFPATSVQSLGYGAGRIAGGEFVIWPTNPEKLGAAVGASQPAPSSLADVVLSLAWHAHSRAELISPAILETYDPERKYSFVGWPEEFRDSREGEPAKFENSAAAISSGAVLEVFGADRKYSFVGQPGAIAENVAFAFAAWNSEIELLERSLTQPFLTLYADDPDRANALATVLDSEGDARMRSRLQSAFTGAIAATPAVGHYAAAMSVLSRRLRLPGLGPPAVASPSAAASGPRVVLRWAGKSVELPAGSAQELRLGLRQSYRDTFREQLDGLQSMP